MSERDNGVSRRLRWAAATAAVLVLGTGTAAAQAVWQSSSALPPATVSSGSLALSTEWIGSWAAWTPLYPGRASDTAILRVTETAAAGTTLTWRLRVVAAMTGTGADAVKTDVFVGACGGTTPLPAHGVYAPSGGLLPGQSVDLCVRATLATDAPSVLQGTPLTPSVTVIAEQATS